MLVGKKSQNNTNLKQEDIKKQKKSTASVKLHLQFYIKYMFKGHEIRQKKNVPRIHILLQ